MNQPSLSPSAQKVQDALQAFNLALQVVELPDSTRTAPDAASAIGCQVGQIVKSLVFQGAESGKPYLVLVSPSIVPGADANLYLVRGFVNGVQVVIELVKHVAACAPFGRGIAR